MKAILISTLALIASTLSAAAASHATETGVQLGPRPFYLVDNMDDGTLKNQLKACMTGPFSKSKWSIGHRGAPMQFPEHTVESYTAAARMGAGILECDVTFTKDRELVCRHAQNDLHTTTNILTSDLARTCVKSFTSAAEGEKASAECRTSEITLAEFRTLNGKMDAADTSATTIEAYQDGTAGWRTDLYATTGTLMTHKESIALFDALGADFTPELKSPSVEMPFEGDFTQAMYAQKMIDENKQAGIDPSRVYAQSFNLEDVLYWIRNEPEFGKQAVYLDDSYDIEGWSPMDPATWQHSMSELKEMGVNYIAPPMWVLVTVGDDGKITPSLYAIEAKEAGLDIITWTAERSGPLKSGGGWYFQTIADATNNDGDVYDLLHVLDKDVGIAGLFSDWPATTTFYANCMGLK